MSVRESGYKSITENNCRTGLAFIFGYFYI